MRTLNEPDSGREFRASRSRFRAAARLLSGLRPLRAGTGSALALAVIVTSWTAGAVVGQGGEAVMSGAASAVGLTTDGITITGQVQTDESDVLATLALPASGSLMGYDLAAARERLKGLPWVRDVAIRKLYPGRLEIALAERSAAAVWQVDEKLTVVERSGRPIARFGITELLEDKFSHLPHLVGEGAPERAKEILPLIAGHPSLAGRAEAFVRIADRRWDMLLSAPGGARIHVMLPEHGLPLALDRLADLQGRDRVLDRQVRAIDLRLADRTVMRLEEGAAEERATTIADREKAMRRILRDAKKRPV